VASEFSIANAAFSVATILASGWVGFCSARRIANIGAIRQANASFRRALAPVCVEIRKSQSNASAGLDAILESTAMDIAMACEVFRAFVPESDLRAYDIACGEYQDAAALGAEFMYKDNGLAEVKRRVAKLLEYAKDR
jgi:hypothetical protein